MVLRRKMPRMWSPKLTQLAERGGQDWSSAQSARETRETQRVCLCTWSQRTFEKGSLRPKISSIALSAVWNISSMVPSKATRRPLGITFWTCKEFNQSKVYKFCPTPICLALVTSVLPQLTVSTQDPALLPSELLTPEGLWGRDSIYSYLFHLPHLRISDLHIMHSYKSVWFSCSVVSDSLWSRGL